MSKDDFIKAALDFHKKEFPWDNSEENRDNYYTLLGFLNSVPFSDNSQPLQTVSYQCCPVCNGTGNVLADGYISAVYQTCKVCNGSMIIPMHILPIDYKVLSI